MDSLKDSEEYQRLLRATKRLVFGRKVFPDFNGLLALFTRAACEEGLEGHPRLKEMAKMIFPDLYELNGKKMSKKSQWSKREAGASSSSRQKTLKGPARDWIKEGGYYD